MVLVSQLSHVDQLVKGCLAFGWSITRRYKVPLLALTGRRLFKISQHMIKWQNILIDNDWLQKNRNMRQTFRTFGFAFPKSLFRSHTKACIKHVSTSSQSMSCRLAHLNLEWTWPHRSRSNSKGLIRTLLTKKTISYTAMEINALKVSPCLYSIQETHIEKKMLTGLLQCFGSTLT